MGNYPYDTLGEGVLDFPSLTASSLSPKFPFSRELFRNTFFSLLWYCLVHAAKWMKSEEVEERKGDILFFFLFPKITTLTYIVRENQTHIRSIFQGIETTPGSSHLMDFCISREHNR